MERSSKLSLSLRPRGIVTETGFERVARQGSLPGWIAASMSDKGYTLMREALSAHSYVTAG
jgi:hypothetical protein